MQGTFRLDIRKRFLISLAGGRCVLQTTVPSDSLPWQAGRDFQTAAGCVFLPLERNRLPWPRVHSWSSSSSQGQGTVTAGTTKCRWRPQADHYGLVLRQRAAQETRRRSRCVCKRARLHAGWQWRRRPGHTMETAVPGKHGKAGKHGGGQRVSGKHGMAGCVRKARRGWLGAAAPAPSGAQRSGRRDDKMVLRE